MMENLTVRLLRNFKQVLCRTKENSVKSTQKTSDVNDKTKLNSGIEKIDKYVDEFQKGKLYVFADKVTPRSGFGVNTAAHIAIEREHPLLYFNSYWAKELTASDIMAVATNTPVKELDEKYKDQSLYEELGNRVTRLCGTNLFIDDTPEIYDKGADVAMADICNKIRTYKEQHGIEIVIIDSFLVKSGAERLEMILTLKALAISLKLPIIIITNYQACQLEYTPQSLQWKKAAIACLDGIIFIDPPRPDMSEWINPEIFKPTLPPPFPYRNTGSIHIVRTPSGKTGTEYFEYDKKTWKVKAAF